MNRSKSIYQSFETVEEIKELALKYLEKYQPSKKSLQVYLFRKAIDGQSNSIEKSEILKKIESENRVLNYMMLSLSDENMEEQYDKQAIINFINTKKVNL